MLPYSVVEAYLQSHTLVKLTKLNARSIHEAMLVIVKHREETSIVPSSTSTPRVSVPPATDINSCVACKSQKMQISEGHYVCYACGIVQRGPITAIPFTDSSQDIPTQKIAPKIKLARWTLHATQPFNEAQVQIGKMTEHWNHWVNLGADDVETAKREALLVEHTNIDIRCIAALLLQRVLEMCNIAEIGQQCKLRLSLTPLAETPTRAVFKCSSCGDNVSTKFEARHHGCAWNDTKRHKTTHFLPIVKNKNKPTPKLKPVRMMTI